MPIKAIITGATGMVGEGVLHECLKSDEVKEVLVVGRRPCGVSHPKLKEIIHQDFFDLSPVEHDMRGFDACFFCLGVSSVGISAENYKKLTYDLTMNFAETVLKSNPAMTFCYVSGAGTDSTEKGKLGWARVKGKTENDLMKMPFKRVYAFRPGFLKPTQGLKNAGKLYAYLNWLYPIIRGISTKYASTLEEFGRAMIGSAATGYEKQILEVEDIIKLSER
jgi:nucleoside-diphosphate-sugar epimerase